MPIFNSSTPNGISLWHIVGRQEGEGTYVYVPSLISGLQVMVYQTFPQQMPRLTYKIDNKSYSVIPSRVIFPTVLSDRMETLHTDPCRVLAVYRVEKDIDYRTVRLFKALMFPVVFHVKQTPAGRLVVKAKNSHDSYIDYLERYRYLTMWQRLEPFLNTTSPHSIMLGGAKFMGELEVP